MMLLMSVLVYLPDTAIEIHCQSFRDCTSVLDIWQCEMVEVRVVTGPRM